ncbi:MAG: DUF2185 domain-containing protein [Pseudomonadota bacterium]
MQNKSWHLEDAQKLAEQYPYTFHKPSKQVIFQLEVGSLVKLIFKFESNDPEAPSAERMWVQIIEVTKTGFRGLLDNEPIHIKDLYYQDHIEFQECHIIDTDLDDPVPSIVNKYLKRCFVTNNILYEGQAVGYLYREESDNKDDSGWRFTTSHETDEYMNDSNNSSYVSLGAVLRIDDSFISLLDLATGAAFIKNTEGVFIPA